MFEHTVLWRDSHICLLLTLNMYGPIERLPLNDNCKHLKKTKQIAPSDGFNNRLTQATTPWTEEFTSTGFAHFVNCAIVVSPVLSCELPLVTRSTPHCYSRVRIALASPVAAAFVQFHCARFAT
jgi:hypothetical protein